MNATVYTLRAGDGSALYVGCTTNFLVRVEKHRRTKEWFSDVRTIDVEHYDNMSSALAHERALILELKPRHNSMVAAGENGPRPQNPCFHWRWCKASATTVVRVGNRNQRLCDFHADGGVLTARRRGDVA